MRTLRPRYGSVSPLTKRFGAASKIVDDEWPRIQAARFPALKSLDTFYFPAIPSLNKALVMDLARCEYIQRRENVIAVGNSRKAPTA